MHSTYMFKFIIVNIVHGLKTKGCSYAGMPNLKSQKPGDYCQLFPGDMSPRYKTSRDLGDSILL